MLLLAPRPASACSKRHETPFELFDQAARVAEVRVQQAPGRHKAGMARLRVLQMLKGSPRATLKGQETNTSCHVGYRTGRRALVFLGPRGETLGQYEGYLELRADDPLAHAMKAFAAAKDPDARVRALVDAIATGPDSVKDEAALYLANRPELLARVDLPSRERLLAAAEPRDEPLLVVLARLELDAPHLPLFTFRPYFAEIAAILRPRDELDDLSVEGLVEQLERGQDGYDPRRIRAMDRCERQRGRMLHPLLHYGLGVTGPVWAKLVAACRTGEPVKH
ncbi:hypothetical protein OV203_37485 [Nannocystis sp. ILAH1]|uniref:hypothetical protein n=1 Tax=unclassified Nannocystis TaxID=2627009 RepID=UPI00226EC981|nr:MULTISPECIES: hypothetical protein [unclassified Nannocystis]MCY0992894.1 hypothetical protein [Nannocystis sp. ILAH1]MCY1066268.1 hypothetical protein [Nannocystis sp. RBIL2]